MPEDPDFVLTTGGTPVSPPPPPKKRRSTRASARDKACLSEEEIASLSLEQARRWVQEHSRSPGFVCPACNRFGMTYWRAITSSMAFCLILLHRFYRDHPQYAHNFIHVCGYINSLSFLTPRQKAAVRGDFTKLRFWGYLEGKNEYRDDGSARNGYWRITESGHLFARGLISAPAHIATYKNELLGMDDVRVNIREALGKKFNYDELMVTQAPESALSS